MPPSNNNVVLDKTIKVVLTDGDDDSKTIDGNIQRFLSNINNVNKIIGLDTEWTPVTNKQRRGNDDKVDTALLILCDGDSCLIHRLSADDVVPNALLNFLRLSDFTFAGMGIKSSLEKLGKEHGFGCKNAVEIGPLAAEMLGKPKLNAVGVDELADEVVSLGLNDKRPKGVVGSDWGSYHLTPKQIKCVTLNAYS